MSEPRAHTAPKRWRRGTVSVATVVRVPTDTWLIVCANAYRSPHTIFRLMMASKAVCAAVRAQPPAWWAAFYHRVCAHQASLQHSNFLKTLRFYATRTHVAYDRALRAIFMTRCEMCGCRRGHRLMRPHALRVCGACLRAHLISNVALARDYGVAFFELIDPYLRKLQGPFLALDEFSPRLSALALLTAEAPSPALVRRGAVFFLWRPLLAQLVDLEAARKAHARRRQAAALLTAVVRRRCAGGHGWLPLRPHPAWIPGGPFHALHGRASRKAQTAWARLMRPRALRGLGWFPRLPQAATPSI